MGPTTYIVMGVSGSGKTTVGKLLAEKLALPYYDADDFHPAENVAKRASGVPLTCEAAARLVEDPTASHIFGSTATWCILTTCLVGPTAPPANLKRCSQWSLIRI